MGTRTTATALIVATLAGAGGMSIACAHPEAALADTVQEMQSQQSQLKDELAETQKQLDQASDDYNSAVTDQQAAQARADEATQRISELEAQISDVQTRLGDRMTEMYKDDQTSRFVSLLLGSKSISELVDNVDAINTINDNDTAQVQQSKDLKASVEAEKQEAEDAAAEAQAKADEAAKIKDDAQAKADEYQKKIDGLDASIRQKVQDDAEQAAYAAPTEDDTKSSGASTGSASSIPTNGGVVDYAYSRLGCPYVWAASGPNSFDCSGLVMWCYAQTGKSLPHSSSALRSSAKAVIPVSEAQPGDVLWRPGHVAICIEAGGGKYIHAPHTGDVVKIASYGMFTCALRF